MIMPGLAHLDEVSASHGVKKEKVCVFGRFLLGLLRPFYICTYVFIVAYGINRCQV